MGARRELQEQVFFSVANLLNLEVDVLFFDTSSTYFELDRLAAELEGDTGEAAAERDEGRRASRSARCGPGRSTPKITGPTCPRWCSPWR